MIEEILDELGEYADQEALLSHLRKFFDGRADAEYFTDSPQPVANHDMRILVMIDAALTKDQKP